MNKTLSKMAVEALTASWSASGDGWCQRWVRQVLEKTYGLKYARYMKSSAKLSALAWLQSPYGFRYKAGMDLQDGDLLYKITGSGGFGHTGIYVKGKGVCENSSAHGTRDARGVRTLRQWGHIDVVVRLPDPNAQAAAKPQAESKPSIVVSVIKNGKATNTRIPAHKENDVHFAPAQKLLQMAGVDYTVSKWFDGTANIRIKQGGND